jgi:hypothetical protein
MLPQQQQQVKNLKDNLSVVHVNLEAGKLHINLIKAINQKLNLGLDVNLERSKHLHFQQALRLEEEKLRLQKADNLASKFTAALEMLNIMQPPVSFRRETNLLRKQDRRSPQSQSRTLSQNYRDQSQSYQGQSQSTSSQGHGTYPQKGYDN